MKKILFLLLALCCVAQAQPPAARHFRTLGLGGSEEPLYYSLKNKDVPVTITEDARSPFYELPEQEVLQFYKMTVVEGGSTVRTTVAEVNLTGAGALPLVIFSHDDVNPKLLCATVLADDLASFPIGSYRVINLSASSLRCIMAGSPNLVGPKEIKPLAFKPAPNSNSLFCQVFAAGPVPIYANSWALKPSARVLVVVAPLGQQQASLSVRRIVDVPVITKTPTAAAQ
jgi:hypothetical protein